MSKSPTFSGTNDTKNQESKKEPKPEYDQNLAEMCEKRPDKMIKERFKQLYTFLGDDEVLSTYGPVKVVQMKNFVDRKRRRC
jgi:hypothetical protein